MPALSLLAASRKESTVGGDQHGEPSSGHRPAQGGPQEAPHALQDSAPEVVRPSAASHRPAAINHEHLSGHQRGAGRQEHHGVGDIVGHGGAAQWRLFQ